MSKGARTIADLERAIRTLQRRARADRAAHWSLADRVKVLEHKVFEHEVKIHDQMRVWHRRQQAETLSQVSPAPCTNSTPPLPRRFAGAALSRARHFFKRLFSKVAI